MLSQKDKDKDIVAHTQVLIERSKITEDISCLSKGSIETEAAEQAPYELADHVLQANKTHESTETFKELATNDQKG